jgi:hypothetical protein
MLCFNGLSCKGEGGPLGLLERYLLALIVFAVEVGVLELAITVISFISFHPINDIIRNSPPLLIFASSFH